MTMPPPPVFTGRVDADAKLVPDDRTAIKRHLRTLADEPVEIVIRKRRSQRSLDQNAFWWAVPVPLLADHCGYSHDQMHYVLLRECFGGFIDPKTGRDVPNKPSSSALTVEEFTHLIDWVLWFGPAELGVDIPPPSKVDAA